MSAPAQLKHGWGARGAGARRHPRATAQHGISVIPPPPPARFGPPRRRRLFTINLPGNRGGTGLRRSQTEAATPPPTHTHTHSVVRKYGAWRQHVGSWLGPMCFGFLLGPCKGNHPLRSLQGCFLQAWQRMHGLLYMKGRGCGCGSVHLLL